MSLAPRVALSQDFLLKLGKLPSAMHARIVKWALKFQQDPTATGINYETIKGARDGNLRSVRIDQDWRGIVFKPDLGDIYILLHVDHHDEAYRWAERRKIAVNPATGSLQIVSLESVDELPPTGDTAPATQANGPTADEPTAPLFASVTDEQLVQLGTPVELLPLVRRMCNERDLDAAQASLPLEAYEGLFLVLTGDSVSTILGERETRVNQSIDTANFAAALDAAESQSRFVVVTSDNEMAAILNAPLAQWRVFLHPLQRKLAVGDRSGPVRILGGAGTGKTVLAMHRAKWLAQNRTAEGQKVLFTTFTRNLALDVAQNMKSLFMEDEAINRLEVINLDRWVHRYLRSKNYEHRIIYKRDDDAWGKAMQVVSPKVDLDEAFYVEEWERVVAAQGVQDLDGYRQVSRIGRRTILGRAKRDLIWPVFEEYRTLLSSKRLKDVDDAYHDAAQLLALDEAPAPYSAIVVDETQDFGPQALRLMRAMIAKGKNDLFFVGDGHQRIYTKHRAVMGHCGIDIRGRSRKLYLNYRTTDEIRKQAVALLEGREIDDLDGGRDDNQRYKSLSHGPSPEIVDVVGSHEAVQVAVDRVRQWWGDGVNPSPPSVCVMTHTKVTRDQVAQALRTFNIEVSTIESDTADSAGNDAVRVSTMHRAKGLEFDRVVVLANGMLGDASDDLDLAQLVYVAMTRAKAMAVLVR
ncbi:UvrD-helicase domain-containing protein [Dyella sp. Tek66A03]|uniref:UvrD-helicase domain-containing protein n=1 Tax=Dyella sp. Tek66A03 TaxID=3458298 RepID=UPI00403E7DEC